MQNNSYIIYDDSTSEALIIDPGIGPEILIRDIQEKQLILNSILLTHAHFDHIAGVETILSRIDSNTKIGLHSSDLNLLQDGGGAKEFGIDLNIEFIPTFYLTDKQVISIGNNNIMVFHTPGHTPGHVTFYAEEIQAAFCGDLIFYHGVGRTDLNGSDFYKLKNSIIEKIYTLPPDTILYNGHGQPTTVIEEINNNPFIKKEGNY